MGRAPGIEKKKRKKKLKQHQGVKEGLQKHSSGAETHLNALSLWFATSTWGVEVAACFADWWCLLAGCNDSVISEQISFCVCKSKALQGGGTSHPETGV